MPRLPVIAFILACLFGGASFAQTEEAPFALEAPAEDAAITEDDEGTALNCPADAVDCAPPSAPQDSPAPVVFYEFDDTVDNLVE